MGNLKYILVLVTGLGLFSSAAFKAPEKKTYKCLIQLKNYTGEGAYIILSIIDKENNYLSTVKVLGDDEEWYPDLKEWYNYYQKDNQKIDGITGATISGGERAIFGFELEQKYFTAENKLRFETAVEDQKYTLNDLEIPIDSIDVSGNYDGSEYIRYVKIISL